MSLRERTFKNIYRRLGKHLAALGKGWAPREGLEEILRENFTPLEAEVALALPTNVIPLQPVGVDEIMGKANLSREKVVDILEGLSKRGLLFTGKTKQGERGYALLQHGFGFPQTWFWKGERTPFAKRMADLLINYETGKMLDETFRPSKTLSYQFIPVNEAIEPEMQGVYSYTMLEQVVKQARVIAVAHCPCRMRTQLRGKGCDHLLEVCLKFDEMAEYLIEREMGREVTKEEALQIIKKSAQDGLVHFVDNALGDIKHNCNCCGCCCWALSPIKKREIPRDIIMATYFIRETDEEKCTQCGDCALVCPVDALTHGNGFPVVEEDWCVGCGICVIQCHQSAARLRKKSEQTPPQDFKQLHKRILKEKGSSDAQ